MSRLSAIDRFIPCQSDNDRAGLSSPACFRGKGFFPMKNTRTGEKLVCQNPKAYHDYFIQETYEAGIVLMGTEAKSLRGGRANLKDSYAMLKNSEIFLLNCHISPYTEGNRYNHEPLRTRKLLLHKAEIRKLVGRTVEKGLTLIPLKIYFKNGVAKVELGLAKGKKLYDKRESIKEKEGQRDIERALKERSYRQT